MAAWTHDWSVGLQPLWRVDTPDVVKGMRWSPDGTCVLTACDDRRLLLYEMPAHVLTGDGHAVEDEHAQPADPAPAVACAESEPVYDYAWYPRMHSADPSTCTFLATCRDQPAHLWDAFSGALRASYVARDELEQVVGAYSATFTPDGEQILCGFERAVRMFHTSRAGAPAATWRTCKTRRDAEGLRGILGCIAAAPLGSSLFALGSYSGATGVYARGDGGRCGPVALLGGHTAGVTHVAFGLDHTQLFTGARRDGRILRWDLRRSTQPLCAYARDADSNQRLLFSLDASARWLATGSRDGRALIYDLAEPRGGTPAPGAGDGWPVAEHAAPAAVSGAMLHPLLPLLGLAHGERLFGGHGESSGESSDEGGAAARQPCPFGLRVLKTGWRLAALSEPSAPSDGAEPAAAMAPAAGLGHPVAGSTQATVQLAAPAGDAPVTGVEPAVAAEAEAAGGGGEPARDGVRPWGQPAPSPSASGTRPPAPPA